MEAVPPFSSFDVLDVVHPFSCIDVIDVLDVAMLMLDVIDGAVRDDDDDDDDDDVYLSIFLAHTRCHRCLWCSNAADAFS